MTGVQTCALPIFERGDREGHHPSAPGCPIGRPSKKEEITRQVAAQPQEPKVARQQAQIAVVRQSALDSESEEAIREALGRLMRGRTVIAIAHRLSTVRSLDRIVVLQLAQVVQDGPPDLLIRRDGPYRRLVEREMDRLATRAAA